MITMRTAVYLIVIAVCRSCVKEIEVMLSLSEDQLLSCYFLMKHPSKLIDRDELFPSEIKLI